MEITPFHQDYGIEHLLEVTFSECKNTKEELKWTLCKEFKYFALVLLGTTVSLWEKKL